VVGVGRIIDLSASVTCPFGGRTGAAGCRRPGVDRARVCCDP